MTVLEIKARIYDLMVLMEQAQAEIRQLNEQLRNKPAEVKAQDVKPVE